MYLIYYLEYCDISQNSKLKYYHLRTCEDRLGCFWLGLWVQFRDMNNTPQYKIYYGFQTICSFMFYPSYGVISFKELIE